MAVDVGAGIKVIQLNFGTFFGACFACNNFRHFARDCPSRKSKDSLDKGPSAQGGLQEGTGEGRKGPGVEPGPQWRRRESRKESTIEASVKETQKGTPKRKGVGRKGREQVKEFYSLVIKGKERTVQLC